MSYPDIILITEASVGISPETLISIARYAPESTVFLKPNMGLDRQANQLVQSERLAVAERSTSGWLLIMDDDDSLAMPVPSCAALDSSGCDVVFHQFTKGGTLVDFKNCRPYQAHGFCGIVVNRLLALAALQFSVEGHYLREDTAFYCYLAMNAENPLFVPLPLINKGPDREPGRNQWLRENMRMELDFLWRGKVAEAQKRLRAFNADPVLYQ